jgi:hypothetical protein
MVSIPHSAKKRHHRFGAKLPAARVAALAQQDRAQLGHDLDLNLPWCNIHALFGALSPENPHQYCVHRF